MKKRKIIINDLYHMFSSNKLAVIIIIFVNMFHGMINTVSIYYNAKLINSVFETIQNKTYIAFIYILVILTSLTIIESLMNMIKFYISKKLSTEINIAIGSKLMDIIGSISYNEYCKLEHFKDLNLAGQLNSWIIRSIIMNIGSYVNGIAMIFGSLVLLNNYKFIGLLCGFLMLLLSFENSIRLTKKTQKNIQDNYIMKGQYNNIISILTQTDYSYENQLFGYKDYIWNKGKKTFNTLKIKDDKIKIEKSINDTIHSILLLIITLIGITISLYHNRFDSLGSVVVFLSAIALLNNGFAAIGNISGEIYSNAVVLSHYNNYCRKYDKRDIKDKNKNNDIKGIGSIIDSISHMNKHDKAFIDIKNVSFKYESSEKNIIDNLSLKIEDEMNIAIIGKNGSGKTTLSYMLLGLLMPDTGEVLINGYHAAINKDINSICAVMQNYGRYKGICLKENITMLNGDIHKDIINGMILNDNHKSNIDKIIGNNLDGIDLSGGEWQKIAIARALHFVTGNTSFKKKTVILDEPTSSLDPLSEYDLFNECMHEFNENNCNVIIITHRLGIARKCDLILVMDEGRIAESGTHDELIKNNGLYKSMFFSQSEWYVDKKMQDES